MILTLAVSQIDFTLNDHKNDSFQCQTNKNCRTFADTHTYMCRSCAYLGGDQYNARYSFDTFLDLGSLSPHSHSHRVVLCKLVYLCEFCRHI